MSFRMKGLAAAIAGVSAMLLAPQVMAKNYESEMIIIHPFQWTYDNLAKECTEYLGPSGFDGVQISQPAEHINRTDVWWAVYQPVNFKNFTTMTGNEAQLRAMIKACNEAGVKVFADAVFNQRGTMGNVGLGGSQFSSGGYSYPDGFAGEDFHRNGCTISNYGDANHVRTCALSGMPDIATDNPKTQDKIADYLKSLMDMGVYGFRVDAAKHMGYTDLESIFQKVKEKAGKRPPAYYEVIGSGGEAADIQPDRYMNNDNTVVTDFSYVSRVADIWSNRKYGEALNLGSSYASDDIEVFVNNHDDEAGRCSAGTCSMATRNFKPYDFAQSWMVVWPYGKVRQVYSGYEFNSHDPAGPINDARCEGGWVCQHRVPMVLNAPRFARATRGQGVTSKAFEDGVLWINRGKKGFYAMNTTEGDITRTFKVEVPDGTYCDIIGWGTPTGECQGNKINVSGGQAQITVPKQSAAAICVGDFCGEKRDPCEVDPSSAQCLCKDSSDKNTCEAYCSTTGSDEAACMCKDEETDKNGLCQSFCSVNPEAENCFCVLNPNEEACQIKYEPTKSQLCYVGSSNGWVQEKMTFSPATGYWTLKVTLTGESGDGKAQRFKVTDGCAWSSAGGTEYGNGSGGVLSKVSSGGDVLVDKVGTYTIKIEDATMKYEFVEEQANTAPVADFGSSVSGLAVTFTDKSSDKDGDKLTYSWDFGDGSTKSTQANPNHTYAKAGTYAVVLTVSDGKASTKKTLSVVVGGKDAIYKKVAVRSSEDNFGTTMMESQGNDIWKISDLEFSKDGKFKIEALPTAENQCVIIGGSLGKPLTASGDFISVAAGNYDVTFNAATNTVTMTQVEACDDEKCGTVCNKGSDCINGICQGSDCEYIEEPVNNTKANCNIDGTTNNCESKAYAYQFLGAVYSKDKTVFRLWSPDSSNVTVDVNGKTHKMTKTSFDGYSDVYEVAVEGDLDQKPYQFKVNGQAVRDPYGKMVVPATYSGSDGVGVVASDNRNVVMNMRSTDLEEGWAPRPVFKNREDAIIYEVHVRDFTVDKSSGISEANRGRYLGMVETGTKSADGLATGIDHLKELGITHVQLLPVYDYGTCSDQDSQSDSCYNWGYDPVNFNVPEDRYTSVFKSENYLQKVKEFKQMVNEFHKHGIRVIMDVVYNHTYNKEMFEKITSKYYTSIDLSGCGNSTDSKQEMFNRFVRDSLEYWATEYNIDGFRFDLVGIFDMSAFKSWGEYLNGKYPERNFLMYGEPWNGFANDPSESTRVRLGTIKQGVSAHVGVFNGKYRECVKGGSDNDIGGFMFNKTYHDLGAGVSNNVECVSAGVRGAIGDDNNAWTPLFAADPEQSINYLTAHDNLTLMDKITKMNARGEYAKRLQSYGNGIMLVSQGIPFIHAGAEFGRSKNMDHNSYKTAGDINNIKWGLKKSNNDIFKYYQGMIAMRKAHPAFRFTTKGDIEANVKTSGYNGAVVVDINGAAAGDSWKQIKLVINSGNNLTIGGVDGWKKKVNGVTVNTDGTDGNATAEGTAVTVWYKE